MLFNIILEVPDYSILDFSRMVLNVQDHYRIVLNVQSQYLGLIPNLQSKINNKIVLELDIIASRLVSWIKLDFTERYLEVLSIDRWTVVRRHEKHTVIWWPFKIKLNYNLFTLKYNILYCWKCKPSWFQEIPFGLLLWELLKLIQNSTPSTRPSVVPRNFPSHHLSCLTKKTQVEEGGNRDNQSMLKLHRDWNGI